MTELLRAENPDDLARAGDLLAHGVVVAVPTETVYGLAANALDTAAVRHIFEIKRRPLIDPLIVHIAEWAMLETLAVPTKRARTIAAHCWPGPLTMILRKLPRVPDLVTAGCPTVAIRMPAHPAMRAILQRAGVPIAAPSANPFGYISPTTVRHVLDGLGERLNAAVDGGDCRHGLESTIIDVSDDALPARILRHGPVTRETLEAVLGEAVLCGGAPAPKSDGASKGMTAPGMLTRHYSPRTPLTLLEPDTPPKFEGEGTYALVCLRRPRNPAQHTGADLYFLSEDGNLEAVAHNVFAVLRALDKGGRYARIFMELPPQEGLGAALRDRLKRAAAR